MPSALPVARLCGTAEQGINSLSVLLAKRNPVACLGATPLDKARALQGEERRLCFAYAGTTVEIESEIHARSTRLTIPEPV
jgi:hypothetical protein